MDFAFEKAKFSFFMNLRNNWKKYDKEGGIALKICILDKLLMSKYQKLKI